VLLVLDRVAGVVEIVRELVADAVVHSGVRGERKINA
jgi:hypothetical protein